MDAFKTSRLMVLAISMILPATGAIAEGRHVVHHDEKDSHEEETHYSDKGEHPSKAERLGVVLQSRVLVDKAGTSDLEVTTGKLDSTATPPGNIDKLEVVAYRPGVTKGDDNEMFEKEYNHLKAGGYAHYTYTNLVRDQRVGVEALVSGFGHGHERVKIELTAVVKNRPDFAVEKLDYPTSARVNTVVSFRALVSERMHDLGAHSDCVLLVDGKPVDQSKGIWIDAGSSISCTLAYRFTTVGQHTVTVRAANVLPGDYDLSNNEMTGQIVVKNPATLFYSASALDAKASSSYSYDYYYSAASTVPDVHSGSGYSTAIQSRDFTGDVPLALSLPLKKVSFADSSDGAPLNTLSFTDLAADKTTPSTNAAYTTESVISRYDAASGGTLTIHRYENANTGAGSTTLDVHWDAGTVTYFGDYYCKAAAGNPCYGGDYSYNFTAPMGTATPVKLGATYAVEATLDDGTAYSAHPRMALSTTTQNPPASSYCLDQSPGKVCTAYTSSLVWKAGNDALVP